MGCLKCNRHLIGWLQNKERYNIVCNLQSRFQFWVFLDLILIDGSLSHHSGWFWLFVPKFWAHGGDFQMPFAIL